MRICVGIDAAKQTHWACAVDADGRIVDLALRANRPIRPNVPELCGLWSSRKWVARCEHRCFRLPSAYCESIHGRLAGKALESLEACTICRFRIGT